MRRRPTASPRRASAPPAKAPASSSRSATTRTASAARSSSRGHDMKAITLRAHGGPEVLTLEELPEPEGGPGQVRVRVGAVALNHVDVWVRRGLPHLHHEYPFVLGADVAGTIDQLGPGVTGIAVGDEIVVNPGHSLGR